MYQCPVCGKYSYTMQIYSFGYTWRCTSCGYGPTVVYSNKTELINNKVDLPLFTQTKLN